MFFGLRKRLAWLLRKLATAAEPGCWSYEGDTYDRAASWPWLYYRR